ncbi:bifunctional 2-polyprenyl-6-hydroxyphenol methylase/3-demethylubiquinol 3-O-methyltransferase UbiG [Streptomyces sp. NPDC041068]|uniref:bifunctional 2-polyprenyl-6-hydroxyphenol methylase/3-demethylubiquinol 3-O-methyltransferase UbiG n=1 Tax=Streptomyces sp. NPDC041068 TaxID=3155130 RepID=UPI0033E46995
MPRPISDSATTGRALDREPERELVRDHDHFFATFADDWWANDCPTAPLRSFNAPRFAYFDQFVDGDWADQKVLDVGCGGGFTTEFLGERGADVSGVDVSPDLVAAADRHARQAGLKIDYSVGRAERLPYPDASFSVVTCVDVLEHVASPGEVVREVHRVLAPGGVFLYDTINRTTAARLMMIWLPERLLRAVPQGTHDWHDFITPAEMVGHLGAAGFTSLGRMSGMAILGKRHDGSARIVPTRDLSCTYMGAARR